MENLTGGTPPVRYLPCVVPCKLYFILISISVTIFRAYALFYVPIVLKNLAYYLTHFLPLLYRGLQFLIFNTVLDSLNDMIIIFYCL